MIHLRRRRPTPSSSPPPSPAFVRELVVVAVGVGLGAILSAVSFLFYAEPLSIHENRGRTEYNRLRLDMLERTMRRVEDDIRRLQEALRTHSHP